METKDVLSIALAFYKDKIQSESLERFRSEFFQLQVADAEARRSMAKTLIMQMAKLKIALNQFEMTYQLIQSRAGKVEALDEYMASVKRIIKEMSDAKNNHRLE